MKLTTALLLIWLSVFSVYAQRGKEGTVTINTTQTVNAYTNLTADVTAGSTSITVANNALNANFPGNLSTGDLIFIIQMQGTEINGIPHPSFPQMASPDDSTWGAIIDYHNCGNHEFAQVESVTGSNQINLSCGLTFDYTAAGRVQVIRVPRYSSLTVDAAGIVNCPNWNGTTGGIIVVEVMGTTVVNGEINANGRGFRGGQRINSNSFSPVYTGSTINEGAEKGEGIAGYQAGYDVYGGRYARAAAANAGGGGNAHNGGGGGGANAAPSLNWTGIGVPSLLVPGWAAAWELEYAGLSTLQSPGGGKGGYCLSITNQDALTTAPGNSLWQGHNRLPYGGFGGRPLNYSTGKIFAGGGGGGGHENDNQAGSGGNGGGIIYLLTYDAVSGSGMLLANGANGENTQTNNPPFNSYKGVDGAGGAGGGGTIIVKSTGMASGINAQANGGAGGNQVFSRGGLFFGAINEAEGPGGGGGGGYIAVANGTITTSVLGGENGTTASDGMTEFTPNGATSGNVGLTGTVATFDLEAVNDTICSPGIVDLEVLLNGTLPPGSTVEWYTSPFGGTSVNSGNTYSINITNTTTFYVGICPGSFRIEVVGVVSSTLQIDDSNVLLSDETCTGNDGSISGILVTGGAVPLTYEWNGVVSTTLDLNNLTAGNYTLVVTDANGCSATAGPYTLNTSGGPVIDDSSITLTHETCAGNDGSISGILVTGGTAPLTYEWNGVISSTPDLNNLTAGNYTLIVTDADGCSVTAGPYTINSSGGPVIDASSVNVTHETCGQTDGSISGITATGTPPLIFSWNSINNSSADTSGLGAGSYTLVVTDANGCSSSFGPITINNLTTLTVDTTGLIVAHEFCSGNNGSINGISATGLGTLSYEWNGIPTGSPDTSGLSAGTYNLVITDQSGCTVQLSILVLNTPGPKADFVYSPNPVFVENGTVVFNSTSSGNIVAWQWNIADSITSSSPDTSFNFTQPGTYTVTLLVMDDNGCVDSISQVIVVLDDLIIPNVVTPNGDGKNDLFFIQGLLPESSLTLFNRWGQQVYSNDNYTNDWNGENNAGEKLTEGTYYYILTLSDERVINGFITLLR